MPTPAPTGTPLARHPVEQTLARPRIADPGAHLVERLAAVGRLPEGVPVAIAVGSRGMADAPALVAALVRALRERRCQAFVVPAMGTHGGASAAAQARVLADLGIDEPGVGAPVGASDEVVCAGTTADGTPVWVDRCAWEAHAIIPVNRVKPHTAFRGGVESGPAKLLAVGLGKAASAAAVHRAGLTRGVTAAAAFLLATGKVPFGVAAVENAYGEVARLEVLRPPDWLAREGALLALARELAPRLPWDELDLLVVERIGKDISGTGADLNVIGLERRFPGCGTAPRIHRVVALDLTPASHGNANGIGYLDVVTRSLAAKVDWAATYANCRATGFLEAARLPYVADDDAEAVAAALEGLPATPPERLRAARILDTAHLTRFQVSAALLEDLPEPVRKLCG